MKNLPSAETQAEADDAALLQEIGYQQELGRCLKTFSNFSVSFSIVCILAGCVTSFQLAFSAAGGAGIGLAWLVGGAFALVVGLSMAQIASAYPTAGGLYHWSHLLGGRCWGWLNAWVNLLGCIFVVASVNVGAYVLAKNLIFAQVLGMDVSGWGVGAQVFSLVLICASQAMINHRGLRLAMKFTDLSGMLIFVLTIVLIVLALVSAHRPWELSRLFHFENLSGAAGGGVIPATRSRFWAFAASLLLPLYTLTGFDGSAHISEETINAQRTVPKSMIGAIAWSVALGYLLICAFMLAFADVHGAAKQGDQVIFELLRQLKVIPGALVVVYVGIVAVNYLCGLAAVTSTSRLIYAFARDGGLPKALHAVNPTTQTPNAAIWAAALFALLATLYTPAFQALAAGCAVFLYIAYAMPIAACFLAHRRGWRGYGPFQLHGLSQAFAIASVLGVVFLTYLGLRPPNTVLRSYAAGLLLMLVCLWFTFARRHFKGPRLMAISAQSERAVAYR